MDYELEKHLIEIGVLPRGFFDDVEDTTDCQHDARYLPKDYFDDPRDATGEVPF